MLELRSSKITLRYVQQLSRCQVRVRTATTAESCCDMQRLCLSLSTETSPLSVKEGGTVWIRQLLELAATTAAATGSFSPFCWALAGTLPCSQRQDPHKSQRTIQDPYTHCSAHEVSGTCARGCSVLRLVIRRSHSAPQQRQRPPSQPQSSTRAHAPAPEKAVPCTCTQFTVPGWHALAPRPQKEPTGCGETRPHSGAPGNLRDSSPTIARESFSSPFSICLVALNLSKPPQASRLLRFALVKARRFSRVPVATASSVCF